MFGLARYRWTGLLVVGMFGCGGDPAPVDAASADDGGSTEDGGSTDDGGSEVDAGGSGETRTTITASAGGTARSADGLFEIIVSPGALAEDTEIVIARVAASAVPAAVTATEPVSAVYSVEPDGLTFGGDGAIVHYHFDTAPSVLLDGARHGAAFPVAMPRDGGAMTWHAEPTALYEGAALDVVARIAHLSYQWATKRDERRHDYYLGVDFDDSHTQTVPDAWGPTIDFQSSDELRSVHLGRYSFHRTITVERVGVFDPVELGEDSGLLLVLGIEERGRAFGQGSYVAGPHAADRRHLAPPRPRFVCAAAGPGSLAVGADFYPSVGAAVSLIVLDPEETECLAQPPVTARILDTIDCVRAGDAIDCSSEPVATPSVTARPASTTTVNLPESPYFVTLSPSADPPVAGPATITATHGAATMTAILQPSLSYDASIDMPLLWDRAADTVWTATGSAAPTTTGATSLDSFHFGALAGLDTNVVIEDESRPPFLGIAVGPGITCEGRFFEDPFFSGYPEVVDLGDGTRGFEAPIRDLLERAATHCGVTVNDLTPAGWHVQVGTESTATLDAGGTPISVQTGSTLRIDGAALTATCPLGRTYCTDRCVDTTSDRMNCGGCGMTPAEICDGVDNDCDFYADEDCPTGINWPVSVAETSPIFGDTMSASTGYGGTVCSYFNPYIGFCGTTSADGTVRAILPVCGAVALRRTAPDAFALDVTEFRPGGTRCEDAARAPSGGTSYSARCPVGMVADGVSVVAPMTGNIGQISVRCARWGVTRDVTRQWVIRRTEMGMSPSAGTGPGLPASWNILDDPTTDNPGALRYLRSVYRTSPPGVLWFETGGASPRLVQ